MIASGYKRQRYQRPAVRVPGINIPVTRVPPGRGLDHQLFLDRLHAAWRTITTSRTEAVFFVYFAHLPSAY
jgi:hypothetical protein